VRHYFFDMGNDSLLAFFEIPKGKEPPGNRNAIGAMQHCAFVVTAERFRGRYRLRSRANLRSRSRSAAGSYAVSVKA